MLYFIAVWLLLLPLCLSIGLWILNILKITAFFRWGDRFILATWLGILALCISYMTVSLRVALSPWVGILTGTVWLIFSLLNRETRKDIKQFYDLLSPKSVVIGFGLAISIAILTTQQMIWFDSGLYHLGSIRWFAQFGAVPGIALIESKLGFTSSWFAFSAPFVFTELGSKIGGITNGFALFLITCHSLIGWHQFFQPKRQVSDGFIALFFLLLTFIYVGENLTGSPAIISFSPDVPVAMLIGVTAWAILSEASVQKPLVVLLLAIGTFTLKMSALPLLGVGILYYVIQRRCQLKPVFLSAVLVIVLLIPNFSVASLTSGCPLFPSQLVCWNLPWTVAQKTNQKEIKAIIGAQNISAKKSDRKKQSIILELAKKRYQWFKLNRKLQFTVLLFVINLILGIVLFFNKNQPQIASIRWLIVLGLVSTSFILVAIPLLRFGIGYFLIIPVLWVIVIAQQQIEFYRAFFPPSLTKWLYFSLVIGLIFGLVIGNHRNLKNRLLLPENIPSLPLKTATINNVTYRYPKNFQLQCWAADLPCSSLPIEQEIELRNPKKGLKAGFRLKSQK